MTTLEQRAREIAQRYFGGDEMQNALAGDVTAALKIVSREATERERERCAGVAELADEHATLYGAGAIIAEAIREGAGETEEKEMG